MFEDVFSQLEGVLTPRMLSAARIRHSVMVQVLQPVWDAYGPDATAVLIDAWFEAEKVENDERMRRWMEFQMELDQQAELFNQRLVPAGQMLARMQGWREAAAYWGQPLPEMIEYVEAEAHRTIAELRVEHGRDTHSVLERPAQRTDAQRALSSDTDNETVN